jgi:hypothetical protein
VCGSAGLKLHMSCHAPGKALQQLLHGKFPPNACQKTDSKCCQAKQMPILKLQIIFLLFT